jgi:hypothetical protein
MCLLGVWNAGCPVGLPILDEGALTAPNWPLPASFGGRASQKLESVIPSVYML